MKRFGYYISILLMAVFFCLTTSSCRSGYGCESTEQIRKTDEKALESNKRGKSGLWSKKQRKKMKKRTSNS